MAIPALGDIGFEHFVQMPLPLSLSARPIGAFSPYLRSEHRTKPVPPKPHRFVRKIDPALVQQILDVSQRQRKADIHHHRQANDLRRRFKVAKWVFHPAKISPNPQTPGIL
jgi:hypothetical protein